MIKLILAGVVSFVVALAGSTTLIVLRTPVTSAADSTAVADTSLTASMHAATSSPAASLHEGSPQVTPDHEPAPAGRLSVASHVAHEVEPVPVPHAAMAEPGSAPADFGRVAKILVNMKSSEAAAILTYLSDTQVEGVLRSLGPRPAAVMLIAMPAERAAKLSQRLLVVPVSQEAHP